MTLPIGSLAPSLTGTDVQTNQPFTLQDHAGKVVLVAFSGPSWCPPCQFEAPVLQEIWTENMNAGPSPLMSLNCPEFQMVMVSVGETESAFVSALQQFGITFPGVRVSGSTTSSVWDVNAVPTVYIIDTDQKICSVHVGAGGAEIEHKNLLLNDLFACGLCKGPRDMRHWVAIATILFGVTNDGGGIVISGGKPIPVPPWDPMRNGGPAGRDALVALAINELAGEFEDPALRRELGAAGAKALAAAAKRLANAPAAETRRQQSKESGRDTSCSVPTRARSAAKSKPKTR